MRPLKSMFVTPHCTGRLGSHSDRELCVLEYESYVQSRVLFFNPYMFLPIRCFEKSFSFYVEAMLSQVEVRLVVPLLSWLNKVNLPRFVGVLLPSSFQPSSNERLELRSETRQA